MSLATLRRLVTRQFGARPNPADMQAALRLAVEKIGDLEARLARAERELWPLELPAWSRSAEQPHPWPLRRD